MNYTHKIPIPEIRTIALTHTGRDAINYIEAVRILDGFSSNTINIKYLASTGLTSLISLFLCLDLPENISHSKFSKLLLLCTEGFANYDLVDGRYKQSPTFLDNEPLPSKFEFELREIIFEIFGHQLATFSELELLASINPRMKNLVITAYDPKKNQIETFNHVTTPDLPILFALQAACSLAGRYYFVMGEHQYVDASFIQDLPLNAIESELPKDKILFNQKGANIKALVLDLSTTNHNNYSHLKFTDRYELQTLRLDAGQIQESVNSWWSLYINGAYLSYNEYRSEHAFLDSFSNNELLAKLYNIVKKIKTYGLDDKNYRELVLLYQQYRKEKLLDPDMEKDWHKIVVIQKSKDQKKYFRHKKKMLFSNVETPEQRLLLVKRLLALEYFMLKKKINLMRDPNLDLEDNLRYRYLRTLNKKLLVINILNCNIAKLVPRNTRVGKRNYSGF